MEIFWFIPTNGDFRQLNKAQGSRPATYNYCKQIAEAVDDLGYTGVLIPTGKICEEGFIVASTLVPVTKNLKYLVAVPPGLMSPSFAARMKEYADLGIETFILSGYPHLEESYTTAELLFHKLPIERKDTSNQKTFLSPFGGDIKKAIVK